MSVHDTWHQLHGLQGTLILSNSNSESSTEVDFATRSDIERYRKVFSPWLFIGWPNVFESLQHLDQNEGCFYDGKLFWNITLVCEEHKKPDN